MKKLLAILVVIILVVLIISSWWNSQFSAVNKDDKTSKTIIIAKGLGLSEISEQLEKEGLIKSPLVFRILVKQKDLDKKIQAGTFTLSPSMSSEEIAQKLAGGADEIWLTLIEGWRIEEMADKLNEQLGINKGEFLKLAKEGYMFPDTYLFPREITAKQIVQILRDTFEERYSEQLRKKIRAHGLTDDEGVILASIVEREARSDKARSEVASILLKRLKIDMGLNADATIQYALGFQKGEKSWWKRYLTKDDLKVDSPYNTYLYKGLPPTPICNPGLSSLQAVANANPNTPYLYYYHDSKGNSHYAKKLDEHNQNVANNP